MNDCEHIVERFQQQASTSTPSLLMTIFGDVIAPHGGVIWLGSLIKLVAPLGISQRLVRTSIYRLAKDGWVSGQRIGRRSYYRLTDSGQRSTAQAESRIYYTPISEWDGEWRMIFANSAGIGAEQRTELKKRLNWLGFGAIATNVYGHPVVSMEPVWELLDAMELTGKVVVMRARYFDNIHRPDSKEMVRQCWKLDTLVKDYRQFIDRYQPVITGQNLHRQSAESSFLLRILLIHHYRRILLRDPQLPATLLPKNWVGHSAYGLCRKIYRKTQVAADAHIMDIGECIDGKFPLPDESYFARFDGSTEP